MSDQPPTRTASGFASQVRRAPVVWTLIAVNVALLLVAEALGGTDDLRLMLQLGAQPTPLPRDELWRMVTATFLHFGLLHLAFNLYALWLFGPLLERLVGHRRFAALYLASGLAGSAAAAAFTSPRTLSAGASGAIFGLLGAFTVLGVRLRRTPVGRAWLRQALLLIGLNLVLGLSSPQIGVEAHVGGLVGGALVLAAMTGSGTGQDRPTVQPPPRGLGVAALVAVASILLGYVAGV